MTKILVISPIPTHPVTTGCSERIFRFLLEVRNLGYEIHYVYIGVNWLNYDQHMMESFCDNFAFVPYQRPKGIKKIGLANLIIGLFRRITLRLKFPIIPVFSIDDWYDTNIDKYITSLSRVYKYDVVIVEYVFLSKVLELFDSSVLKIIDTHDVFTNRHNLYLKNRELPSFFYTDAKNERKGLQRADRIIAIQDSENTFFSDQLKLTKPIYTVKHFIEIDKLFNPDLENNIVYFGSSNTINQKSMFYFLEEILPLIEQAYTNLNILIYGSICNKLSDDRRYQKLGIVEDKRTVYRATTIFINPMLFGTGLKIKNVECLGYGIPLVTSSIGAQGIEEGINHAFLVADNPTEFASAIIRLISDVKLRSDLSSSAIEYAKQYNRLNQATLRSVLKS